jgi:fumarate hydratase class II
MRPSAILNDVRFLGTESRCHLGELKLRDNDPGSTIMHTLLQVCAHVMGNQTAIKVAGACSPFRGARSQVSTMTPFV